MRLYSHKVAWIVYNYMYTVYAIILVSRRMLTTYLIGKLIKPAWSSQCGKILHGFPALGTVQLHDFLGCQDDIIL